MLLKRALVALIGVPLIFLCLVCLPPIYFFLLLLIISAVAQYEFYAMYKTKKTLSAIGIIGGIALFATPHFPPEFVTGSGGLMTLVIVIAAIMSARLFMIKDPDSALRDIAPAITGVIYIPLLLMPVWYLRLIGYEWIVLLFMCVWTSDTFAYFIGKNFGKRKLYKEVSPNKTVAGAVGSVAGGVVASMLVGTLIMKDFGMPALILIGAALGAVTILGDLAESMLKRDAGVKDSGSIIPGHGGVLDRIDSLLFAAPVLYLLRMFL